MSGFNGRPLCFLAVLAGCFASCSRPAAPAASAAAAGPPAPVRVAISDTRTVPVEIATVGNVEASTTIGVKAVVCGTIMKVHIADGHMIRVGELSSTTGCVRRLRRRGRQRLRPSGWE